MKQFLLICAFLVIGCSAVYAQEPTEEEMKVAARAGLLQINKDVEEIAKECRGQGSIIVDPFLAFKCASVCYFDPKECTKIPYLQMTEFKKLACAEAVGQPGYVCDYQYTVHSESSVVMNMFTTVYGSGNHAQARFFKIPSGEWMAVEVK